MSLVTFDWEKVTTPIHDDNLLRYNQTDTGNAEAFLYLFGKDLRFIKERKQWVKFDGVRWKAADELVHNRMIQTIRSIRVSAYDSYNTPETETILRRVQRWTFDSESEFKIKAALQCVENFLAESINDFDRDKWLLACENETIDLRTGTPRVNSPENLLLKSTGIPYLLGDERNPEGPDCLRWIQFLDEVFQDDKNLIKFVQKAVGYTLTGDTSEQSFFLLYGLGANGKSVFLAILEKLVGEYGITATSQTFMEQRGDSIPNDVARMAGARFVKAIEVKEMSRFNIEKMKSLTGGDRLSARFLHSEFFDFNPVAKFWLAVNHRPSVNDPTYSFWRRCHEIPFNVTFGPDKQDKNLIDKLTEELPGILHWAIDGCLLWQKEGFERPQAIIDATEEYRGETDSVGHFLDECTERDLLWKTKASVLYMAYKSWCEKNGYFPVSVQTVGVTMKVKGYEQKKSTHKKIRFYMGIRLRDENEREIE